MAHARLGLAGTVLLCLGACASGAAAGVGPAARRQAPGAAYAATHVYVPADDDVPNPERGFYRQFLPFGVGAAVTPLDDATLAAVRQEGLTLVRAYFVIDEFAGSALPRTALDDIDRTFAAVRRAGLKIIPRLAYNFPNNIDYVRAQDAPLDRVLGHIDQLAPVFAANADVIAFVEAGFVGAWGEWHTSSNGLLEPDRSLNSRSAAILARLLSVLPSTRMVALRYPFHKQQLFGRTPLTAREAYGGTAQARVGAHNDCLASGPTNAGTFSPPPALAQTVETLKSYLGLDNRYVPQGGETCGAEGASVAFPPAEAHCVPAVADLARMHWSALNLGYHRAVLDLWRQEGCFADVRRRLGYRFRLLDGNLPARAVLGRRWSATLRVTNDGFAAPYNPRLVELVWRHAITGREVRFPVATDPRFWGAGETYVLQLDTMVPDDLDEGGYDLFLHLPDPERGLYGVPAYSIRLANAGVWEAQTGFNRLQAQVTVAAPARERLGACTDDDTRRRGGRRCTG